MTWLSPAKEDNPGACVGVSDTFYLRVNGNEDWPGQFKLIYDPRVFTISGPRELSATQTTILTANVKDVGRTAESEIIELRHFGAAGGGGTVQDSVKVPTYKVELILVP